MSSESLFDEYVDNYDGQRRKMIPGFERFYGTLLDRIEDNDINELDVIDLGAGTGLASEMVLSKYPKSEVTLVDESEEMLGRAREKLDESRCSFLREDLLDLSVEDVSFDAAVSALVLHYLTDDEKRVVLDDVYKLLRSGGKFAFGTVIKGWSESVKSEYDTQWKREARRQGVGEQALQEAVERQDEHHLATVEQHLEWMRETGFRTVDCWFKFYGLAVMSGTKP